MPFFITAVVLYLLDKRFTYFRLITINHFYLTSRHLVPPNMFITRILLLESKPRKSRLHNEVASAVGRLYIVCGRIMLRLIQCGEKKRGNSQARNVSRFDTKLNVSKIISRHWFDSLRHFRDQITLLLLMLPAGFSFLLLSSRPIT